MANNIKTVPRIYFPQLDSLRFFAFLLVFVHHHRLFSKIPRLSFLHDNGWIGVDLFFALSSFLFTKLLVAEFQKNKTINIRKFYFRRLFRIWPLYFAFVCFSVLVYWLKNGSIADNIGKRIFGLFSFSDNIFAAFYGYNPLPYVPHLWTIAFEEQFYVVIPLIILLLLHFTKKTKTFALVATVIVFTLARTIMIAEEIPEPAIWVLPITHFDSMVIGIVIGFGGLDFLLKTLRPLAIGGVGLLFFSAVCILPSLDSVSYWLNVSYPCVGISTGLVLLSALHSNSLKAIGTYGILIFLGKRSYGLYVFHFLGNAIADHIIRKYPSVPSTDVASFLYSLGFTIFASIISYKYLETPFLKLKSNFEVIKSRPI